MKTNKAMALALSCLLCGSAVVAAQDDGEARALPGRGFIENRGQWDSPAYFFLDRGSSGAVALDRDGARLLVVRCAEDSLKDPEPAGALVCLRFCESGGGPPVGCNALPGYLNYYEGSDPSRWVSRVPRFSEVRYPDVRKGIDILFRVDGTGRIAYDVHLGIGADLAALQMECLGITGLSVDGNGGLILETAAGRLVQTAPRTWQVLPDGSRRAVQCRFELLGPDRYGFRIEDPTLDAGLPLCIDPSIDWATYLGGDRVEWAFGLTVAAGNEPVVAGGSCPPIVDQFPITPGAFQSTYLSTAYCQAFVSRFTADGSQLVYSTLFGGFMSEEAMGVEVDPATQEVVVTGYTTSPDMPTTPGAFSTTHANPNTFEGPARDLFVARFSADGTALVYSTYIGGIAQDRPWDMALAPGGEVVIVGMTDSPDFPITAQAVDATYSNGCGLWGDEGFVTRLAADGSNLVFSTFLGGLQKDTVWGVVLDAAGDLYVCGQTASVDFPMTTGSFDTVRDMLPCRTAGFVAKLSALGDTIEFATYLENNDVAVYLYAIALDDAGRPVATGSVIGPGLPTTPGAFSESPIGSLDGLLVRFDSTLSSVDYCTYFGSILSTTPFDGSDQPRRIAPLSTGEIMVGGDTNGSDFPVTSDALQPAFNGPPWDGFVLVLDPDEVGPNALRYGSYVGGGSLDMLYGLEVDGQDRILVSLRTQSQPILPGTVGGFDPLYNGTADVYLFRFRLTVPEFRRGDVNGDASLDIADAVAALTGLFGGGALPCRDAADANDDGADDIADAVFILQALFSGGASPPDPGPAICGVDPSGDALNCLDYGGCP